MKNADSQEAQKAKWSVTVLFENTEARDKAVVFCDRLVEQSLKGFIVEVNWWGFDDLAHTEASQQSLESASAADFVLFATESSDLPLEAKCWVEQWIKLRGDREGALVNLCEGATDLPAHLEDAGVYLRKVAQRAGMDYFTCMPHNISRPIPDSFESYVERADQMTSVLDDILKQPVHVQDYLLATMPRS